MKPDHLAIIMDGNRRWAKSHGLSLRAGYEAGVERVLQLADLCIRHGIGYLTVYALSVENFHARSALELDAVFYAVESKLDVCVAKLVALSVRVDFIGDIDSLPDKVRASVASVRELTRHGSALQMTIALNYGSQQELTSATRKIAQAITLGTMEAKDIDLHVVARYLYRADLPAVDLLLRTGCDGRMRLSNFLLWQIAYAELFFCAVLWPDYDEQQFCNMLQEFAGRQRLFGR